MVRPVMLGDLVSNTLLYSLVAAGGGTGAWVCEAALGLAAGIGAVVLPGPFGRSCRATIRHSARAMIRAAVPTCASKARALSSQRAGPYLRACRFSVPVVMVAIAWCETRRGGRSWEV